jgi:mono/diheme cytochrome c family protein
MSGAPSVRRSLSLAAAALAALAGVLVAPGAGTAQPGPADIARGKYIYGATGGCGCHTEQGKGKPVNAGGRRYDGPFGTMYSTNITPDRQTGIGAWTDEQIITAIRLGRRPNGERLVPVHPFTVFNGMAEEDLKVLVAFLRTVPPVNRANQPRKLMPLFETVFLPGWLAAFAARETPPPTAPTAGVARGEYLVRAVAHCGECHTPRRITQATDNARFLAGNPTFQVDSPKGMQTVATPNITPDRETGLTWSEEEIADYLGSGNKPDGDVAGSLMAEVIEGNLAGYKDLTKADRLAIAQYLKSIPPVRHRIGK